jgi:PAS domain S-box-containing protein
MSDKKVTFKIDQLKDQIINRTLVIGTSIGFLIYLLSLTRLVTSEFHFSYIIEFLVIFVLIFISIYRKKINIRVKSYIAIGSIYSLFLADVIRLGVFSADKILIVLIPFFSLLSMNKRISLGIFISTIFSFMVLGYFHYVGVFNTPIQDKPTIYAWLVNILFIIAVASIVLIIQSKFNSTYDKLLSDLELKNLIISEKERNYREIFNSSTDAIFIHDLNGRILDVNESMLKMYGYEGEEMQNLSISELSSQNEGYDTSEAMNHFLKALEGESQVFDWLAKKKNGDLFWVEVALKKTMIGENERVLAIVRDINCKKENSIQLSLYQNHLKELVFQKTHEIQQTNIELLAINDDLVHQKEELITTLNELQRTQQQLVQSEKMASLGILAAGVAHEINNPLNFIQGGLYGIEDLIDNKYKEQKSEFIPLLKSIEEGVNRASKIVTSLNHYNRASNDKKIVCNIHSIIENCLLILNNKIKYKAEIQKEFTHSPIEFIGNEGQLHQLILNILTNSVQAIAEKGLILIRTSIENETLRIEIKDNGCGISEENLPKIYDPFFTTKEVGQGTGLGLSISAKIIQDHKGTIEYQSRENVGTHVIISFQTKKI